MLVDSGNVDDHILHGKHQRKPTQLIPSSRVAYSNAISNMVRKKIEEKDVEEIAHEILSKELISGNDLKKLREAIGIKLEEVFEITRISVSVLDAIENDQFESLPAAIYLKNFLRQYGEILQIDSKRIIEGYTRHISSSQNIT